MGKKVVQIVLNNFQNDSRVLKESKSLSLAGYTVLVLAIHEHGLLENELIDNVSVRRIKLTSKLWPKSKFVQVLKYMEFFVRAIDQCKGSNIVHCNDLNALPIGVLVKLFNKNKLSLIYDAHEYEINDIPYQSKLSIKLKYWIEKVLIQYVDKTITVSDSIAKEYQRLYNIPKPALVLNTPPFTEVINKNLFRKSLAIRDDQAIFLYQGGLGKGRGIEILLEAFSSFDNDNNVLLCMGYGSLEKFIKEQALRYPVIFFHPAVSPDVLLNYTASADYGISFIEDTCLSYRYCLPNKMFEYIMAGLPVLTSNLYEMKRLVEAHNLGVFAEENTVDGFVNAVQSSLELDYQQIQANVKKIRKEFCWEEQEIILLEAYEEL